MMSDQFDLSEYLRPLLRWWWLLAAAMIVAATASFIYTATQPPMYVSQATIMVGSSIQDPNPNGGEFYLALQLADTYADIANRAPLQRGAMEALGLTWLPYYSVSQIPNRPVIQLLVYDQDPERTYRVAEELTRQIILLGPREEQNRRDFVDQQLTKLQDSITQTENLVIQRENELLTIDSARELANKQAEIRALHDKLATMQRNYADLLSTTQRGAVNALKVLEPATYPTAPIPAGLMRNLLVAAIAGLALAAAGAYLLEYLDKTFRDAEEMRKALGLSLLGSVPAINAAQEGSDEKLIMIHNDPTAAVEAYRMIRTNLQFTAVDQSLRLLLITSAEMKDGKSLTAANLSIALASTGKKVVLVDADLHRPTQQRLFKLYNHVGVTTALLNANAEIHEILQPTIVPGLSVLTSGPLPPNPAELLGTRRMNQLLAQLQEIADMVVIDSPPLSAVVDSLILATQADGVLMVVRAQKTRRDLMKHALNALHQIQTRVIGVIFNGVPVPQIDFYNHKYGYYQDAYGQRMRGTGATTRPVGAGFAGANLNTDYDLVQPAAPTPENDFELERDAMPGVGSPIPPSQEPKTGAPPTRSNGAITPFTRRRSGLPRK